MGDDHLNNKLFIGWNEIKNQQQKIINLTINYIYKIVHCYVKRIIYF